MNHLEEWVREVRGLSPVPRDVRDLPLLKACVLPEPQFPWGLFLAVVIGLLIVILRR